MKRQKYQKKHFLVHKKIPKTWVADVNIMVFSKLVETKNNSKYENKYYLQVYLGNRTYKIVDKHCMKIRIFVLRNFVKRTEKTIFSLVFVCFRFTQISYFLNFPSNKNIGKQHLSANAYSCLNMTFPYTISMHKDEILCVVLLQKQAIFHLRLRQLFVDDI